VRLTGLTGVEPLSESCPVSPAGTGLTGGATCLTGVGQWTQGLVFRCVLGSKGCVCWFLGPVALQWLRGLGQLG
jgi:hypothetical protein